MGGRVWTAAAVLALAVGAVAGVADGAAGTTTPVGTAGGWGRNWMGQLGDGTTVNRRTAVATVGIDGLTAIAAGQDHTLARRVDGTVWAWGGNGYGQLGDGTHTSSATPVVVGRGLLGPLGGVVGVAAGANHNLAVREDGSVFSWGSDSVGQLGDGLVQHNRSVPLPVLFLGDAVAVAAGEGHSLALKRDGTVWAWGLDFAGTLGQGTTCSFVVNPAFNCVRTLPVQVLGLDQVVAIAAGRYYSLALRADGTATARSSPVVVVGVTGAFALAGGATHSVALTASLGGAS